ncbi:hypothetical protein B0H14DRAFT_3567329 [Mycena olivaceomarginata]|nr:hypothetical protein B0H14DRAFT_3567329 [Mycena olivaceomarginata]
MPMGSQERARNRDATITTFRRRLDSVCRALTRLHGPRQSESSRRRNVVHLSAGMAAGGKHLCFQSTFQRPIQRLQSPVTQRTAIGVLLVATGITAGMAWFLLESVSALSDSRSPITRTFLGLILLPILGNVTEHWTAFTMAKKDKMTDSSDIALGSALEIVAWITGVWKPSIHMDLVFEPWQTVILFVATSSLFWRMVSTDWLEGFGIFLIFVALATISDRR